MAWSPVPVPMLTPHVAISATGRRVAGVIATIAWVALELQVIISAGVMTAAGHTLLDAVGTSLSFFTVVTNLLVAIPLAWLVFPVSYLIYVLVRGAVDGWHPYFFINASAIGYRRTLANAAMLTSAMFVAGCLVVTGARIAAFLRSER